MPREKSTFKRISGVLNPEKFIVIASEGTKTEYKYFTQITSSKYFNSLGKVEICQIKHSPGLGNPLQLRAQIKEIKRDQNLRATDEFFMVIDTDQWCSLLSKNGYSFDSFIDECLQEDNVQVLISNPSFEIWLILHLKQLMDLTEEQQKLLLQNLKINGKTYAKQLLSEFIPGDRGFSGIPSPQVFLPRIYDAINNAKQIRVPEEKYPKQLGSYVYLLVEKIVIPQE